MGVDPALVQISYEYTDMRYLTRDEMALYRVTTSVMPTPDVRDAQAEAPAPTPKQDMPLPATAVFVPPTVRTLYVSIDGTGMDKGQRAIFYQQRGGPADGTADMGTVTWSVVDASFWPSGPVRRVIRAEADIPNTNVRMVMTIYRNDDPRLPDDPIVELVFDMPQNSDNLSRVLGFALKDSEPAIGSQIILTPATNNDGFFLVALAPDKRSPKTNTDLLRNAKWIDIAMVYESGRRALFTLKSDLPGNPVFAHLLDSWERPADHGYILPAQ
jgi:hypothetical protein